MEWISPAIFHTLWCIRPWNSRNISSLLPETEARGTARAMFSLNESRRRSPYSSHGALVQHSLSELVLGQHILIPKTVLSVKILSFWCFWGGFFCQKFEMGKGKKGKEKEGRKASCANSERVSAGHATLPYFGSEALQHHPLFFARLCDPPIFFQYVFMYLTNVAQETAGTLIQHTFQFWQLSLESEDLQKVDPKHFITCMCQCVSLRLLNQPSCSFVHNPHRPFATSGTTHLG